MKNYRKIMNKKIITVAMFGALVFSGVTYVQASNALPSAGIKPDSAFFFLDRLGELIQEFFTFNPETKAELQIEFAGERIAEINAMVEEKGSESKKGVEKAKTLLLGNIAYAAEIIKEQKAGGKDVSKLARDIDNKFDAQEKLLVKTFQDARRKLKIDRIALKKTLAEQIGDTSLATSLEQQISELESQDSKLKNTKDEIKKSMSDEREKIEQELDSEDKLKDDQEKIKEKEHQEAEELDIENEDESEDEKIKEDEEHDVSEAKDGEDVNGEDERNGGESEEEDN